MINHDHARQIPQNETIMRMKRIYDSRSLFGHHLYRATINRCILQDVTLTNCTVVSSELRNCRLFSCKIERSKVHLCSELYECTSLHGIQMEYSFMFSLVGRDCDITYCTLVESEIRRSKLVDCEIRSCHVRTTKIDSSLADRSMLVNCHIDDCQLRGSSLHEFQTPTSEKTGCSESRSPLALRRFPPEIRAIVFSYSSHFCFSQGSWRQTSRPRKLAAILVLVQELYQELMAPVYNRRVFSSNYISPSIRIGFMGNTGLQKIRKLTISDMRSGHFSQLSDMIHHAVGLQELNVKLPDVSMLKAEDIVDVLAHFAKERLLATAKKWVNETGSLRVFTTNYFEFWWKEDQTFEETEELSDAIAVVSSGLGVQASRSVVIDGDVDGSGYATTTWSGSASPGEVLSWKGEAPSDEIVDSPRCAGRIRIVETW